MAMLEGKVAIVTGAGSGIGRAITLRFAREGASVLAVDVSGAQEAVAGEAGGDVRGIHADVSVAEDARAMIEAARREWGRLDVLCNNAGITRGGGLLDTEPEDLDRVLAVNVRGPFLGMKYGIPLMRESGGGSIINVASIGSLVAQPGSVAYFASKGAVLMLTKAVALEHAADGIRVNAICPGTIETPLLENAKPGVVERLLSLHAIGRLGRPEEIASMAVFLASDESSFAVGAAFVVDGGRTAT
jgi:NAD(P)-dependent dehydrogenase (short-subunit alcohol dehydrogenase family)